MSETDSTISPEEAEFRKKYPNMRNLRFRSTTAAVPKPAEPPAPEPPAWLDEASKTEWLRLAPSLAKEWKPQFSDSLAAYCVLWARFLKNPDGFSARLLGELRQMQHGLGLTMQTRKNRGY